MSEEKIIQHGQNAVHLLKSKSKSIKEKILGQLYSRDLPFEREADITVFQKRMDDFDQNIGAKAFIDSSGKIHISRILGEPAIRYQIFYYRLYLSERQNRKKAIIKKMLAVADEVQNELDK